MILIVGPSLQSYAVGLVSSDGASLYDGVNNYQVTLLMDFPRWFVDSLDPYYLLIAALVAALSGKNSSSRELFFRQALLVFVSLSAYDLFTPAQTDAEPNYFARIISNLVGAPIIAAVLLLALHWADRSREYLVGSQTAKNCAAVAVPPLAGLAIAYLVFLLGRTVYTTSPSKFDLTVSPPFTAAYSSKGYGRHGRGTDKSEPRANKDPEFGFLLSPSVASHAFTWVGKADGLHLNWAKARDARYAIKVKMFEGCSEDDASRFARLPTVYEYVDDGATSLRLNLDNGWSELAVVGNDISDGKVTLTDDTVNMFGLAPNRKKTFDLTLFLSKNVSINHDHWRKASYLFSVFLMEEKKLADRRIEFEIDGKKTSVLFVPRRDIDPARKVVCKELSQKIVLGAENRIELDSLLAGGLVSIVAPRSTSMSDVGISEATNLVGTNGWFTVSDIRADDLEAYVQEGRLDTLTLDAKLDGLRIDDADVALHVSDTVQVTAAELRGFAKDSKFQFLGTAKAVYVNGFRANKSLWERLDWQLKVALLLGAPAALWFFVKAFARLIQRDEAIDCLRH